MSNGHQGRRLRVWLTTYATGKAKTKALMSGRTNTSIAFATPPASWSVMFSLSLASSFLRKTLNYSLYCRDRTSCQRRRRFFKVSNPWVFFCAASSSHSSSFWLVEIARRDLSRFWKICFPGLFSATQVWVSNLLQPHEELWNDQYAYRYPMAKQKMKLGRWKRKK